MSAELKHHSVTVNGIRMHVAEQGEGPLVVLCHGWPELWYSWRHQLPALASAGFRAVAPDMRGYGQTDAPQDIRAYSIFHLVGDIVALVEALGEKTAAVVGHDWGAPVAWHCAMMRPDVFRAVVGMSVPHRGRGPAPPLKILKERVLHAFYWMFFQEPGVAEAEFERDVPSSVRRILYSLSGDSTSPDSGTLGLVKPEGFLGKTESPANLPSWLTETDMAVFTGEYQRTGFRGGLNWYRNIDANWELTAPWQGSLILQPALFIAGSKDGVIQGNMGASSLESMGQNVPNLRRKVIVEGAGHWIQQERPQETNAALVDFLGKEYLGKQAAAK